MGIFVVEVIRNTNFHCDRIDGTKIVTNGLKRRLTTKSRISVGEQKNLVGKIDHCGLIGLGFLARTDLDDLNDLNDRPPGKKNAVLGKSYTGSKYSGAAIGKF